MGRYMAYNKPDPELVTYYVYKENSVTTIKAFGFKIIEGALVLTTRNNDIVRVFASGVWKEIIVEARPGGSFQNDTGY